MRGRTLSHYELLDEIGKGGMGVVYRARDGRLNRLVAIKLLPLDKMSDPDRKRRFVQEAKAASALNHPNIVTIHEIDSSGGADFMVMELVDGVPLLRLIPPGGLPIAQIMSYAGQIADALAAAHTAGIIHRDIKPGNIMVTQAGRVKVLDFGLAKLVERIGPGDSTIVMGPATEPGVIAGTVAYASPEQIETKPLDVRSDIFSFGDVLYEMLTGQRPFQGDSQVSTIAAILRDPPRPVATLRSDVPGGVARILQRCLQKNREARYPSAVELRDELAAVQARLAAPGFTTLLKRPLFAAAALAVLLVIAGTMTWFGWKTSRARWARNVALPAADQMAHQIHMHGAWSMLRQAARYIPDDPQVRQLRDAITMIVSIRTEPAGAELFVRDYGDAGDQWESLGHAPMNDVRIPFGYLRWKIMQPGFVTLESVGYSSPRDVLQFRLEPEGTAPAGMLRVPAGNYQLTGSAPVDLPEYWIDKYEVTNRRFKEFMDRGGYRRQEYWKQPFVENGRSMSWEQAMLKFRDATGRPGPSTWELGAYPEGQADFPVSGVSWYEATAYAGFAGLELPAVHAWFNAAGTGIFSDILRFSNFDRKGPARVGTYQGIGPYGTYDMAGNIKEWCWNQVGDKRYILGGAWSEPNYMFMDRDARPPFDRSPTNGLRCVKYSAPLAAALTGPVERVFRDYTKEKPVNDQVFEALRSIYSYDQRPLDARVESTDDSHPFWRKEKITFTAAYGDERMPAYLFLPKNSTPPYQTLVYHPGADALALRSSDNLGVSLIFFEFAMRSGRAVLFPIYKGTYERHVVLRGIHASRDLAIQGVKDAARSVDYLETRPDIDHERIAFYGLSWGANRGPGICAIESHFKTCVLVGGGLALESHPPEVDAINFAPRAHAPLLMLNGRYDFDQSSEQQARPLFRFWGAPEKDKRMVIYEAGHLPANLQEVIREILDWLDLYLGPVKIGGT